MTSVLTAIEVLRDPLPRLGQTHWIRVAAAGGDWAGLVDGAACGVSVVGTVIGAGQVTCPDCQVLLAAALLVVSRAG